MIPLYDNEDSLRSTHRANLTELVQLPNTYCSSLQELIYSLHSRGLRSLDYHISVTMSPPIPVPNSSVSFWRSNLHPLDNHRTTEALPSSADIVIIGAGYAGASTAYHILEKSADSANKPSIVILEAREACSGATGRNGAVFSPQIQNKYKLKD